MDAYDAYDDYDELEDRITTFPGVDSFDPMECEDARDEHVFNRCKQLVGVLPVAISFADAVLYG